ncbi:MAG: nitroreductase family protein [Gudongella sp.]|nr:nitroreductase family protein [Gudongella sp.]
MSLHKSIFEIIKTRKSVRSYLDKEIEEDELKKIMRDINKFQGPFRDEVRFELIIDDKVSLNEAKLGTYGIIQGAKYYLAVIATRDKECLFELGYATERAILYLTDRNLGTCWMGGTFERANFANKVELKEGEYLPVVVPFGYIKDKQSIKDKMIRMSAGSDKRTDWGGVFFNEEFGKPLHPNDAGLYKSALEAVRVAPSASNKQPWRVIKKGNDYEFYLNPTPGYGDKLGFNIQEVDIGIAMCHFEMVAIEDDLKGQWDISLGNKEKNKDDMIYVAKWRTPAAN